MFPRKTDRKIIPRLRRFWTTVELGQLSPAENKITNKIQLPAAADTEALSAWRLRQTVWHALDLVGAASVIGDLTNPDVISAARYLDATTSPVATPARVLVSQILHPGLDNLATAETPHATKEQLQLQIRSERRRLASEPRNAIRWADVAFLYTSLGQFEKARHAMDIACNLAPDNRFVVRSAARFLVHVGENEKALRLLRNATTGESDPWVAAAEIGVSSVSDVKPTLLKLGRRMVEDHEFTEFAKTELASAIATIELKKGNARAAKKLFRHSLVLPTENSLAQAEWAAPQIGQLDVRMNQENVPRNFEAKAVQGYRLADWPTALLNSKKWLNDQPFSIMPAQLTCYLYNILGRHEDSRIVVESSLVFNRGDRHLTNDLAFALINLGDLDKAEEELNKIDPAASDDPSAVALTATRGLLLFRREHPTKGREMYLDAINMAKRHGNKVYAALAALHLAFEEIRASTETREESVKEATKLAARSGEPDVQHFLGRLRSMAEIDKRVLE